MASLHSWYVSDQGRFSVAHIAARTLRKRFATVWAELKAACGRMQNAEHVHQLRVATRRTLAAMEAFADLLPPKKQIWFTKRLRRIRRAASDARDLDVLTDRLAGVTETSTMVPRSPAARKARGRLVAMLSRQRIVSREPIREIYEQLVEDDWHGRLEHMLEGIAARRRQPLFTVYARERFRPFVERFFAKADRKLRDEHEIHDLRIEGKQLRYALEIFAGVFPVETRRSCQDALEELQRTLGEFTDHAAAADRFRRWSRDDGVHSDRDTLDALRKQEVALANRARKAFAKWWSPARRRTLRRVFERSLRRDPA
ncbi:MAG: CHAD domain-containing protein [Planctomycetia bacterium]